MENNNSEEQFPTQSEEQFPTQLNTSNPINSIGNPINSAQEKYKIISQIGSGGMGKVYKAFDNQLQRIVAIKVMLEGQNNQQTERFIQEAKAMSQLNHPNIIRFYDIGMIKGQHYFSMEFVEGGTLRELLKKKKRLAGKYAAEIMLKITQAIGYAHQQGVIHRDLKPENIMLREDGEPVIMDFGIAKVASSSGFKLTKTGAIMGTLNYMSPEQANGITRAIDQKTDIYSLGAILYEMIAGHPPFVGTNQTELMLKIFRELPPRLNQSKLRISESLEAICFKALAKDKKERYANAMEMANDLNRYLQGIPVLAQTPNIFMYATAWLKRHAKLVTVNAIIIFILMFVGYSLGKRNEIPEINKNGIIPNNSQINNSPISDNPNKNNAQSPLLNNNPPPNNTPSNPPLNNNPPSNNTPSNPPSNNNPIPPIPTNPPPDPHPNNPPPNHPIRPLPDNPLPPLTDIPPEIPFVKPHSPNNQPINFEKRIDELHKESSEISKRLWEAPNRKEFDRILQQLDVIIWEIAQCYRDWNKPAFELANLKNIQNPNPLMMLRRLERYSEVGMFGSMQIDVERLRQYPEYNKIAEEYGTQVLVLEDQFGQTLRLLSWASTSNWDLEKHPDLKNDIKIMFDIASNLYESLPLPKFFYQLQNVHCLQIPLDCIEILLAIKYNNFARAEKIISKFRNMKEVQKIIGPSPIAASIDQTCIYLTLAIYLFHNKEFEQARNIFEELVKVPEVRGTAQVYLNYLSKKTQKLPFWADYQLNKSLSNIVGELSYKFAGLLEEIYKNYGCACAMEAGQKFSCLEIGFRHLIFHKMGNFLMLNGNFPQAEEMLLITKKMCDFPQLSLTFAYLYLNTERYEKARQCFEECLKSSETREIAKPYLEKLKNMKKK